MPRGEGQLLDRMPHRVTNFFKASTNSLESQVSNLKKKSNVTTPRSRRTSPRRTGVASIGPDQVFSYVSSISDDAEDPPTPPHRDPAATIMDASHHLASNISELQKEHQHHRRLSFPSLHLGRSSKEGHSHPHVNLDWKLESPPIVFYGDAENSSGALVSGQLLLNITRESGLDLESFNATLSIHVAQKRPFSTHCSDCTNQITQLRKWTFTDRPLFLAKGQHTFPFSVLLEGNLPISMDGPLSSVSYVFKAEATPKKAPGSPTTSAIKLEKVLDVKRSLPVPETPHLSIRVFPPTNIKASVHYPQVIHPIGNNTLTLRLDGIAKHNELANAVEYWKLKKLTWRLEETAKILAPACAKHAPAADPAAAGAEQDPSKRSYQRTETRTIGEKTLFAGWKSNYGSASDSTIEMELDYHLGRHARFSCNTQPRDACQVTHQLMIEMVVSQEMAPVHKPTQSSPTGIGRILRMHFGTVLTERAGIGISWDNEAPPIYQDVPASPPAYSPRTTGAEMCPIEDAIEPLDGVIIAGLSRRPSEEAAAAGGGASSAEPGPAVEQSGSVAGLPSFTS